MRRLARDMQNWTGFAVHTLEIYMAGIGIPMLWIGAVTLAVLA